MLLARAGFPATAEPPGFIDPEWAPVAACPLCASGSDVHQPFASHAMGTLVIRYLLCERCGLVFQSPRLTTAALDRHYQHEYRKRSHSQEHDPRKDRWVQERRAGHLAAVVRRHQPQFRRHLDVGSSFGILLATFSREFGSEGYGVEPGVSDRMEARATGQHVVATMELLPREAAGTFELVTLSHVLEHLPDPIGTLRLVRKEWLAAEGLVLVETPDLYSHPSFELGHLVAFSEQTLQGMLSAAGFEVVELRRHGKPYSRILPLFLLAVARAAPTAAGAPLRRPRPSWIRIRRWLGMTRLRWARLAARRLLGGRQQEPWVD